MLPLHKIDISSIMNHKTLFLKKISYLLLLIPSIGFSQTPITNANFQEAIATCLTTNPIDGMCDISEYGAMPNWDVSNITDMSSAFSDRIEFNGNISDWDVSNVIDMSFMFTAGPLSGGMSFNQDIGDWDVKIGRAHV